MRHRCLGPFGPGTTGWRRYRSGAPPIDEDALKAAAKRLGAAKRPLIVAGGGALDAAAEVTQLSHLLQAPVLSYRRGRGVLSDRDPLSVNLPLGHELWAEADVVLGIGTRLHMPLLQWGFDRDLAVISIDMDPEAPARIAKPKVALIGNARPILQRLLDLLPTYNHAPAVAHRRDARTP